MNNELSLPAWYDASKIGAAPWRVPYMERAAQAEEWARQQHIPLATTDTVKVALMLIDLQNTFCHKDFELYVMNAEQDNGRVASFIYRNAANINQIALTLDTHLEMQIFHPVFWVNQQGQHPDPGTSITAADVKSRKWMVNPTIAGYVTSGSLPYLERHALHYVDTLEKGGRYALTVWPYHAMLGGIGHALDSMIHEAAFTHSIMRKSGVVYEIKGGNLLTENYSIIAPEVTKHFNGNPLGQVNADFYNSLMNFDYVVIAGQAKSHCVAWTIDDILTRITSSDPNLARKVYLLEDCTSPVIIPGVVDCTDLGNQAFERFAKAGMNVVKSTLPMKDWPGVK